MQTSTLSENFTVFQCERLLTDYPSDLLYRPDLQTILTHNNRNRPVPFKITASGAVRALLTTGANLMQLLQVCTDYNLILNVVSREFRLH